ncbi:MAG: ABC transporter permease subunit [Candidatus Thorarchaeota archaeon]
MRAVTFEEISVIELKKRFEKPPKNTLFITGLLVPGLIIFIITILIPIVAGIFISFTNSQAAIGFFGDRLTIINYYELLTFGNFNTRNFWQFTYQTLFFSVVSLILEFILGLMFALILNKKFRGRGIARATLLIPWAIPTVASATIFRFEIFNTADEYGLINSLIGLFGGAPVDFFGSLAPTLFNLPVLVPYSPYVTEIPITMTMFTAIIIDVWKTTPFITLLILAALQIVPQDLYKAGDVAGATGWQKFRYITLPLIKPGLGVALIFRMMQALRVYDAIIIFNDSSVDSMTSYSVLLWLNGDYGLASAVTVMLLLFIVLFAFLIILLTRTERTKISKPPSRARRTLRKLLKTVGLFFRGERDQMEELIKIDSENTNDTTIKEKKLDLAELTGQEIKLEPISESKVKGYIRKRRFKRSVFIFLAVFMCLFCAAPFVWIVIRSFRDPYITQTQFEIIPIHPSFRAYEVIFMSSEVYGITFEQALLNGFILSGLTVLVVIVVGSFIAYAIAKFNFKGKRALNGFTFSMNSLPPLIIIIPFFIQTIAISDFLSGNRILLSYLGIIIGIAFAFVLIVFFIMKKSIRKGIFIVALSILFIGVASIYLYLTFAPVIFATEESRISTGFFILIIGGIFLGIEFCTLVINKILKRRINWKIFGFSCVVIFFISYVLADFIITTGDPFNLLDNKYGLVLPYSAFNIPLAVFILVAFFREIPAELWSAAKVDGASNFQIFRKIILPLTIPGIFTCAILVFIASWNELLFAQIFLTSPVNQTVPRTILRYVRNPQSLTAPWDTDIALMAATSLATIPLIIVVLIFQRKIISGLTRGAVKG